jgi:hypothetical protein
VAQNTFRNGHFNIKGEFNEVYTFDPTKDLWTWSSSEYGTSYHEGGTAQPWILDE